MQIPKPKGDFGLWAKYVHVPCMPLVAKKIELPTFIDSACGFDTYPTYDEYDENNILVHLSPNHMPQEFNPNKALDKVKRDQQVDLFHGQCMVIPNKTMHFDMIVGNRADFNIIRSTKMQLKILLGQHRRIRGGQRDVPYGIPCPSFQVVDAKQLCSTLENFQ